MECPVLWQLWKLKIIKKIIKLTSHTSEQPISKRKIQRKIRKYVGSNTKYNIPKFMKCRKSSTKMDVSVKTPMLMQNKDFI